MGTPRLPQNEPSRARQTLASTEVAWTDLVKRRGNKAAAIMWDAAARVVKLLQTRAAEVALEAGAKRLRKALAKVAAPLTTVQSELARFGNASEEDDRVAAAVARYAEAHAELVKALESDPVQLNMPNLVKLLRTYPPKLLFAMYVLHTLPRVFEISGEGVQPPPTATDLMELAVVIGIEEPTLDPEGKRKRLDAWGDLAKRAEARAGGDQEQALLQVLLFLSLKRPPIETKIAMIQALTRIDPDWWK